tara:strand:+ start:4479 stop:4736 length:258 start_codon:yes stop_codon:yes gene_type:complete
MAYKLRGDMITGAVTASIVPQSDGTGSTLVHIVVTSAQDVIQTRGGGIVGRIHMVGNSSIDLVKESTDTIDIAGDAFVTPIAYHY